MQLQQIQYQKDKEKAIDGHQNEKKNVEESEENGEESEENGEDEGKECIVFHYHHYHRHEEGNDQDGHRNLHHILLEDDNSNDYQMNSHRESHESQDDRSDAKSYVNVQDNSEKHQLDDTQEYDNDHHECIRYHYKEKTFEFPYTHQYRAVD